MQEIVDKIEKWVKLTGAIITQHDELSNSIGTDYYVGSVNVAENYGYNIAIEKYTQTIKISTYYRFKNGIDDDIVSSVDYSDDFVRGILISTMQMNLNYLFINKNDTSETYQNRKFINLRDLESIEISKLIFFDGLNQTSFFDTCNCVIHAVQVIQLLQEQILRKIKKVKENK